MERFGAATPDAVRLRIMGRVDMPLEIGRRAAELGRELGVARILGLAAHLTPV